MQLEFGERRIDAVVEGTGPAIVLLHGFPLAKETWDAQAAALAKRARVVRFDFRGLGKSSVIPGPYLMESLASDCSDVIDALGIARATIVGHSLGGYVAFEFFRLFSERCAGLGIVASRAAADEPAVAERRRALADRVEREGMAPIAQWYMPRYFADGFSAREPALVERTEALVAATDPRGAAAMLRGMATRVSSFDLFDEIAIPVRVVGCTHDALAPLAFSEDLAAAIATAKIDRFACGHIPLYEEADRLTASLGELLDEVAAAERAP